MAVGVLKGWRWVIGIRGFANIVKCVETTQSIGGEGKEMYDGLVYGLIYSLSNDGQDEKGLDKAEGVPWAYGKIWIDIEVVKSPNTFIHSNSNSNTDFDTNTDPEMMVDREMVGREDSKRIVRALVYVDPRAGTGKARDEYVVRMNRGIEEAVGRGLPVGWVVGVLRGWIPAQG